MKKAHYLAWMIGGFIPTLIIRILMETFGYLVEHYYDMRDSYELTTEDNE